MAKRKKPQPEESAKEPTTLAVLEFPPLANQANALRWCSRVAHSLAWLMDAEPKTIGYPEVRRAAVAAALDLEAVLDALADDPQGARFETEQNPDRVWLAVAGLFEGVDSHDAGRVLDERLGPLVRALRDGGLAA